MPREDAKDNATSQRLAPHRGLSRDRPWTNRTWRRDCTVHTTADSRTTESSVVSFHQPQHNHKEYTMETAILLLIAVVITAVIATDIERKRKFATFVDTAQELAALKLDHSRLRERYTRLADVVTAANAVRDGTGMPPSPLTTRNPKPDLTPGSLMYDPEPRPWVVLFENPDLTVDFVVTYAMDKADAIEWGTLHASKMAPGTHCVGANPNLDAVLCTQFDSAATLSNFRDGRF